MSCEQPTDCPRLQFTLQETRCPSCRGQLLIFVGEYVSWEDCLSCDRSGLIAWSSWQPGLVPAAPTPVPVWTIGGPS